MASGTQSSSCLQSSRIASLFCAVPSTAELIVYELSLDETTQLLLYTEPAIYHFCRGPGGGFDRFLRICGEGKRYRWHQNRLPDPPRLLVEEWQRKLLGKRLVDEDSERSEDVCLGIPFLFISTVQRTVFRNPYTRENAIHFLPKS